MSIKENIASSRHCSIESGLTQAIAPVGLLCGIPEKDLKSTKSGSDHLAVPSSKMAKMKKKMHSPLSRRKSSSSEPSELSSNTGKVFGVSLDESIKHNEGPPVPWVVVRIVEYLSSHGLKSEGIFRVSGNKKNVDLMKAAFDRDGDADLEEIGDVMAVAGLLKQYLRDLPRPPIPQSLTQDFIKIHTNYGDDNKASLDELKRLLAKLPELNYHLLKYLCNFLVRVSEYEENNKMSSMALAIVFGPNLFRCKDGLEGLKEQGHTNAIVCKFLQEYEELFPDEDEVSPYATTDLFIQTSSSSEGMDPSGHPKAQESSASDEELASSNKTTVEISIGKLEPVYASISKSKKHLSPSVGSSSEDLDLYVRSVSPSLWNTNGNNGNSSHSTLQQQQHGTQGRDMVQKVIKDSIKEHLFGPDVVSTDDNEYSPNESAQSNESLEEIVPPLPARNYGPEDTNRPQAKKRKNAKKHSNENSPSTSISNSELTIDVPAVDNSKDLVITLSNYALIDYRIRIVTALYKSKMR
ncbi:Protein FAM13A [Exaiptasia diaphana]|nr:Protein FAM13A [Exaiptasia diaphana]